MFGCQKVLDPLYRFVRHRQTGDRTSREGRTAPHGTLGESSGPNAVAEASRVSAICQIG